MAIKRRAFKGAASFHLGTYGGSGGLTPVGNVTEAVRSITTEEDSLTDYESVTGGLAAYDETVTSVDMELTVANFAPHMLAIATLGAVSAVAASAVVDERVIGWRGKLVPFDVPPDPAVAPVVKAEDGVNAVTWAASTTRATGVYIKPTVSNGCFYKVTTGGGASGASQPTWPTTAGATVTDGALTLTCMGKIVKDAVTDYAVGRAGIVPTDTTGAVEDGRALLVSYTRLAGSVIETLTAPGQFWTLFMDGANRADGGKPVTLRGHKVKISSADSLPSVSDKFSTYKLTAKFLRDDNITGAGLSQYIREFWGD